MNYNIIASALVALGFCMLFFLDNLIPKTTENSFLKQIRENNLLIAVLCMGAGYYVYTLGQKQSQTPVIEAESIDTSEPLAQDNYLPTYEEATSTDEILNM